MAGVVAARAPWREDRSPSHLSDSTRVSSDPPAVHPARDDDDHHPASVVPSSSIHEVQDLLASLRVAPNQVAGHSSKGVGLPSLVDDSGHFLKPAPDDRKGVAELAFYERVWKGVEHHEHHEPDEPADDDEACSRTKNHRIRDDDGGKATMMPPPSLAGIAPFVPKFHGVLVVDPSTVVSVAGDDPTAAAARDAASRGQRAAFLRLEDVTAGFRKPCVIDLKVGLRTYSERGHDSAYVAKRSAHDRRSGQFEVGFKVCGMQTWRRDGGRARRRGGGGGRDEDENTSTGKNEGWANEIDSSDAASAKVKRLRQVRSEGKRRVDPDGWIRNTRPYSWARGLCTKEDARRALEEFVGVPLGDSKNDDSKNDDSEGSDDDDDDAGSDAVHDETALPAGSSSSGDRDGSCSNGRSNALSENGVRSRRVGRGSPRRSNFAREVYTEALRQIASMRAWFATQRTLHLLGSSVLIVYEGDRTANRDDGGSIPVRVKAIDFCNYVEGGGELDTNFGEGLDRLSRMLESIVAAHSEEKS